MQASKLIVLLFALLALFPVFSLALISASQSVDFISSSGFLVSGESAELSPAVQVSYSGAKYWVVSIISGNSISGFAAFNSSSKTPEILLATQSNQQVFKTEYFLRLLKDNSGSATPSQWFFMQQNSDYFSSLSRVLRQEKDADLSIIASEAKVSEISSRVASLKSSADSAIALSNSISSKVSDAMSLEDSFFQDPSPDSANSLAESFSSVKNDVDSLEQISLDYSTKVSALKKAISDANISLDVKVSLSKLADAPDEFSSSLISSKKQSANYSISKVDDFLKEALSNSIVFSDSLKSRVERMNAYSTLYSEDTELKQLTKYSSLQSAVSDMFSDSKALLWKNQSELSKLSGLWNSAESSFQKADYAMALETAKKAKQSVIVIFKSGFKQGASTTTTDTNSSVFLQAAVGVAAILGLLFFIQKVLPKLSKPKGEEGSFEDLQDSYNLKK